MTLNTSNIKLTFIKSSSTFRIEVGENYEIVENDFIEVIDYIKSNLPNKSYKVLIVTLKNSAVTKNALSYLLNNEYVNKYNKGEAIVSNSLMVQLSTNFYSKFIAKSRKIRVFKNEIEAILWLDTLPLN